MTPRIAMASLAAAGLLTAALGAAPVALADPTVQGCADPSRGCADAAGTVWNGNLAQRWEFEKLGPSTDFGAAPGMALWEATATATAVAGSIQPVVPYLTAHDGGGNFFTPVWGARAAAGV